MYYYHRLQLNKLNMYSPHSRLVCSYVNQGNKSYAAAEFYACITIQLPTSHTSVTGKKKEIVQLRIWYILSFCQLDIVIPGVIAFMQMTIHCYEMCGCFDA
ncbi:unnamed protein product [Ixodes persulcatus]